MKNPPERRVRVAELKARLSAYLRAARRGEPVTVYDRDTPIARLVPYRGAGEPLRSREPTRRLGAVELPPPLTSPVDSLRVLREERQPGR